MKRNHHLRSRHVRLHDHGGRRCTMGGGACEAPTTATWAIGFILILGARVLNPDQFTLDAVVIVVVFDALRQTGRHENSHVACLQCRFLATVGVTTDRCRLSHPIVRERAQSAGLSRRAAQQTRTLAGEQCLDACGVRLGTMGRCPPPIYATPSMRCGGWRRPRSWRR